MTDKEAIEIIKVTRAEVEWEYPMEHTVAFDRAIEALEQRQERCIWIKYDHRTICPKECGGENPYWRIPYNMEHLKYCPYCGRKIEVKKMNQNEKDALAAAMLIKAYCNSLDADDCSDGSCIFSNDGDECILTKKDPEFWQLDKAEKK